MILSLGLDIGTTKSACVVRDTADDKLLFCRSLIHNASLGDGVQSVKKHREVLHELISAIPENLRKDIETIGVTGQMHGVLCWNEVETTELFTWQSQVEELAEIQKIDSTLQNGFGITTLASLSLKGFDFSKYRYSGTIHDYAVYLFCGKSVIDYTDAASFGAYDIEKNCFKEDVIKKLNIPEKILPDVVAVGSVVGETCNFPNLKDGIKVMAAIGDNQASVFASCSNMRDELFLTIGTGIQLSGVVDKIVDEVEIRPFVDGKFLAVASPLCGGAAWAWLEKFIKGTINLLGVKELSDEEIYKFMDEVALKEISSTDLPRIMPNFLGERGEINLRGSITNLTLDNFSIGKIAAALALGIIKNLFNMMPEAVWQSKKSLIASGNAIRKSTALQQACRKISRMNPILIESCEEAAQGAAKLSERLVDR